MCEGGIGEVTATFKSLGPFGERVKKWKESDKIFTFFVI